MPSSINSSRPFRPWTMVVIGAVACAVAYLGGVVNAQAQLAPPACVSNAGR